MIIRKDRVDSLPEKMPNFERQAHATRWQTLRKMREAQVSLPHDFLEVELSV
jgi:hypothetical protein